jgi:phosphatidylglycerol---prolipoprotein diacylglyceryl transferase
MRSILFSIGAFTLHSYGLMLAIAFLVGIYIAMRYARREGLKPEIIIDLSLYVIVAAIVGARSFYVLGQWSQYRDHLLDIIMIQKGGLVFLGGLIFAIATVAWYAKRRGIPVLKLFDVLTPASAFGYAIGRFGCFLNGCCFGLPTDGPFGIVFPPGALANFYFHDQHIHPTQLYSMGSMLAAFVILLIIYNYKRYNGQIFYWGLVFYSIYRFVVEFFRFSPIHWLGLTPSQWIVIPIVIVGIYGLSRKRFAPTIK